VKRSLALLAVLFLLLRPVCDAWAAGHAHAGPAPVAHAAVHASEAGADGHEDFCCAKVQEGNLISPGSVGPANAASDVSLFVAAYRGTAVRQGLDRHGATRLRDAPLASYSFYARSARILR